MGPSSRHISLDEMTWSNYSSLISVRVILTHDSPFCAVTFAIQYHRLHLDRRAAKLCCIVLESTVVTPVTEEEWFECNVIIRGAGSVESHRTSKTISVLQRVVAMIPRCAILGNIEYISKAVAVSNWALRYAVNSIHFKGILHSDAVPVDRSAIVSQLVFDCDFERVTPASLNPWTGILEIENFTAVAASHTISIDSVICDFEIVL